MALQTYSADPQLLRETFSFFPSGVAALAAEVDGSKEGLVASSFTVGVSMDPPLVLFAAQNTSRTWPLLRRAERIGISVLADSHADSCRQLASKDKANRFGNLDIEVSESGAVFLQEAPVWLECTVHAEIPAGDHHVVLLEITALRFDAAAEPLIFHGSRFKQLMPTVEAAAA